MEKLGFIFLIAFSYCISLEATECNDLPIAIANILSKIDDVEHELNNDNMAVVQDLISEINYDLRLLDSLHKIKESDEFMVRNLHHEIQLPNQFHGWERILNCNGCWAQKWSNFWCGNSCCSDPVCQICLCCPCAIPMCVLEVMIAPLIPGNYSGGRCQLKFKYSSNKEKIRCYLDTIKQRLQNSEEILIEGLHYNFESSCCLWPNFTRKARYQGANYIIPIAEVIVEEVELQTIEDRPKMNP